jgi:hypothetical protein
MQSHQVVPDVQRELRWIADSYEQAQRVRIQTGERIRALLQGRDSAVDGEREPCENADALLTSIRAGSTSGPSEFLGRLYCHHAQAEEAARAAMRDVLERHPAWPWLSQVRGVGDTLACRLLARLNPRVASTPSGFWAYCGLATVPGREYACDICGRTLAQPLRFRVSGTHRRLRGAGVCPGTLRPTRGPEAGVRVAQPRQARGERPQYDRTAKVVCYLVCVSFLRCRGAYASHYRTLREDLERTRPGWDRGRIHLTALRRTEKLFLTHLWVVWRQELALPVSLPHAAAAGSIWSDPWAMIGGIPDRSPEAAVRGELGRTG